MGEVSLRPGDSEAGLIGQAVFPGRRVGEKLGTGDVPVSLLLSSLISDFRKTSPTAHSQGSASLYQFCFPSPLTQANLSLDALGGSGVELSAGGLPRVFKALG